MFFKSLKSRIILFSVSLIIFSLLTTMFIVKRKAERELSASLENNGLNLLETIKLNIQAEYTNIKRFNESIVERRKAELRNNVEILHSTLEQLHQQVINGAISQSKAKKLAIDILNNIKFENNIGYFWITNQEKPFPKMINHSFLPELNGQVLDDTLYNCVVGNNKNLFVEMVDIVQANKQGFVQYKWPRPGNQDKSLRELKLSFVKLFNPWGWIIGTGVYMDDIEIQTNQKISKMVKHLNKTIAKQMVSESGYCFIFGENNFMYVHPYLANRSGDELINPSTSNKILNDIKRAYHSGDKYMEYLWNRIDDRDNFTYPKRVYIKKFKPLGWYICVSVYEYDFEQKTRNMTNTIIFNTLLFISIAIILSLFISRSITSPLKILIDKLKVTDSSGLPAKLTFKTSTQEITTLKTTINTMISSIDEYRSALREERDFSMGIINDSPDIICGLKNDGTITFINPAGVKLTKYEKKDLYNLNFWHLLDYADKLKISTIKNKIISQNQKNLEIVIKTRNGKSLTLLWNSIPFSKHDNHNIDIFGSCINITDRKKAEIKSRYFQNYLSNIINSMPSSIIGIDASGEINQINDKAKHFFHLTGKSIIGQSIFTVLPCLDLSKQQIQNIIKDNRPKKFRKNNFSLFDKIYFLELTLYPLQNKSQTGAVIRIDDITENIKLEEMMIQSEKMLSIGGLAAGMAHEINNPLAGMMQNATVLLNRITKKTPKNIEVAREYGVNLDKMFAFLKHRKIIKLLNLIHSSGQRASKIITNMLSFARKSDTHSTEVYLPDVMDAAISLAQNDYDLKKKYDFRKIKIIKDYQEDLPKYHCDKSKLEQVFLNLLKNGAHAMNKVKSRQSIFKIRIYKEANDIEVEIEDNGPGIPEKIKKRIFEPFFTTKNVGTGTGLGLSVSYFIITENHNGAMWVESVKDKKTNFIIKLPLAYKKDPQV